MSSAEAQRWANRFKTPAAIAEAKKFEADRLHREQRKRKFWAEEDEAEQKKMESMTADELLEYKRAKTEYWRRVFLGVSGCRAEDEQKRKDAEKKEKGGGADEIILPCHDTQDLYVEHVCTCICSLLGAPRVPL